LMRASRIRQALKRSAQMTCTCHHKRQCLAIYPVVCAHALSVSTHSMPESTRRKKARGRSVLHTDSNCLLASHSMTSH
jgi:hypothetical protein